MAEQSGLTLQLLPMLVGFFTYKVAVLAKQSLELFGELSGGQQGGTGGDASGAGAAQGSEGADASADVASVDRAFRRRVLNEL